MTKIIFFIVTMFVAGSAFAQQTTASGGGTGKSDKFSLDWTVGELTLVSTVNNSAFTLTQGVQQGLTVAMPVYNGILDGELMVFPNPTSGLLTLQTGFFEAGTLTVTVYDLTGKLIRQEEQAINSFGTHSIDLTRYAAGIYMLNAVFQPSTGDTRKRAYKILRLN